MKRVSKMGPHGTNTGSKTSSERQQILHNYCDHSQDISFEDNDCRVAGNTIAATRFPLTLHLMLQQVEEEGLAHIVSWEIHGRAFKIHKPQEFEQKIIPRYFNQTKITSFHRQLNLYGFLRFSQGRDKGAYYHELFLRGKNFLSNKMFRQKVKGCRIRRLPSPDTEPDFYSMPYITTEVNYATVQRVDCNNEYFLDEGDFEVNSFDSDPLNAMVLDSSFTESLIKNAGNFCDAEILEYFLEEEPDSIFLECKERVQYYSLDECNLIFRF